jgi:3-oxoacyl-[acyl-carrier protein] reductase
MTEQGGVVVVTGAAQGLGRAIAQAFADAGYMTVVSDLRADAAEQAAKEIAATVATPIVAARCDVTDEAQVATLADAAERLGSLTVWVNNAGLSKPALLHKMAVADFETVLSVHARGTFLGVREAAQRMIAAQTPGTILNVTSSAGLQGTVGQINYSAAKGAITSMTKSAAKELARYAITVNAVAPVATTPMTEKLRTDERLRDRFLGQIPLRRFGAPDEAAAMFVYLGSASARYITGQVMCVDGGLHMAS